MPVMAQTAPLTLVTYSVIKAPQVVDVYLRHGKASLTPDGPTVGEYASQAVIVCLMASGKMAKTTHNFWLGQ